MMLRNRLKKARVLDPLEIVGFPYKNAVWSEIGRREKIREILRRLAFEGRWLED